MLDDLRSMALLGGGGGVLLVPPSRHRRTNNSRGSHDCYRCEHRSCHGGSVMSRDNNNRAVSNMVVVATMHIEGKREKNEHVANIPDWRDESSTEKSLLDPDWSLIK